MGSYPTGTTIAVEATFIDERTGKAVNPDAGSLRVRFFKDGSVIYDGTSDIYQLDVGKFACDFILPETLEKGIYVYEWSAKVKEKPCKEFALFRVRRRKGG